MTSVESVAAVGPVWKDDASRVVYGVVSVPEPVSAAEIEKAAHNYLARYEPPPGVALVESYIAPDDMSVAGHSVTKGSWVLGTQVTDPGVWARVQKGESVYPDAQPTRPTIRKEDMSTSAPEGISSAARSAIGSAMALLQPYASQDGRIEGLVSKLGAIRDSVSKADQLADELLTIDRATTAVVKADGPMSPGDRAQSAQATRAAEAAYLEAVGGNVDAWRAAARENGRAA